MHGNSNMKKKSISIIVIRRDEACVKCEVLGRLVYVHLERLNTI
jgi:hypothetical protein